MPSFDHKRHAGSLHRHDEVLHNSIKLKVALYRPRMRGTESVVTEHSLPYGPSIKSAPSFSIVQTCFQRSHTSLHPCGSEDVDESHSLLSGFIITERHN